MEGRTRRRLVPVIAGVAAIAGALLLGGIGLHGASGDPTGPDASVTAWGTPELDQNAPTGDESTTVVDAPTVNSYDGSSSYTTDTWPAASVNGPNDLNVVTSTAPGTVGVSGVVTNLATGAAVGNAKVVMSWVGVCTGAGCTCFGCICPNPCLKVKTQTTYTDSRGGYAFVDTPDESTFTFTVTASGFGTYTASNLSLTAGTTYEMSAALTTSPQSFDESQTPDDPIPPVDTNTTSSGKYGSNQRIPPYIRVAMYAQTASCAQSGSSYTVTNYAWDFYVTHVFVPEVGGASGLNADSGTANAEVQSGFGWYWRIHSSSSPAGSDVTNTTQFQCFKPDAAVPTNYPGWIATAEQYYVGNADQTVQQTNYLRGSSACNDTSDGGVHQPDHNDLSQLGSIVRGQSSKSCYMSRWQDIDEYYFTGTVQGVIAPPTPSTSFSRPTGKVKLNFTTTVGGADTAWTYSIDRYDASSSSWKTIATVAYSSSAGQVPTSYTYATTKCQKYRVKASNPAGWSSYASFNGGSTICPG